jgi:hypothetical protein
VISFCCVILDSALSYFEKIKEWLPKRTSLIKEGLFCKIDAHPDYYEEFSIKEITCKIFGTKLPDFNLTPGNQHAMGLHACIDRAKEKYIMCCDPDIFFYPGLDQLYINLIEKNNIQLIGVSHHAALQLVYNFFPCATNWIFKKDQLPPDNWLEDTLCIKSKYLVKDHVRHTDKFPNPEGYFDVGSYIWLWAKENNWRWLSFQTIDCHLYTTNYYRSNFKIFEKIERNKKLLYHGVSGTINPEIKTQFIKSYEDSLIS